MPRLRIPTHRLAKFVAIGALATYVLLLGGLLRDNTRIATLGDALALKRRETDAVLERDKQDIDLLQAKKNLPSETLELLREERQAYNQQGLQNEREYRDWRLHRTQWRAVAWFVFAFAHLCLVPVAVWGFGSWYRSERDRGGRRRRRSSRGRTRKRSLKAEPSVKPRQPAEEPAA